MKEPFLINPPKKKAGGPKKKKKTATKAKRKGGFASLPASFAGLTRHRPIFYQTAAKKWTRSPRSKSKIAGVMVNPHPGLMVAGANPYRVKRRRSVRKNPVIALGGPMDFARNMPYLFTGALSATAVSVVPAVLAPMVGKILPGNMGTMASKLLVTVGGGYVINMVMPKKGHGAVWALVGSGIILADVLKEYVLKPMKLLADYEINDYEISDDDSESYEGYGDDGDSEDMGAFPDTEVGMGAFPATSGGSGYYS